MNLETNTGNTRPSPEPKTSDEIRREITKEFALLGVPECPGAVIDHLVVLEEHSRFNNDSRMIREGFGNVIAAIEERNKEAFHLTPKQKEEGVLAAFVHDIGKSSSSEDPACRLAVVKLFSIYTPSENQTVLQTIRVSLPDEAEEMISNLAKVGVTPDMTMRTFWDKHAFWTREILDRFPDVFSERTRIIAASHHIDREIDPCGIGENAIPPESRAIGALEYYIDILQERLLMVVDQYQAQIARGGSNHEKAMEYLRKAFKKYENDLITNLILDTIDELGSTEALFPKTQKDNLVIRKG